MVSKVRLSDLRLTRREIEVLQCMADGMSYAEMCARMGIVVATIKVHRKNAIHKLDARNSNHAVAIALRAGIIT